MVVIIFWVVTILFSFYAIQIILAIINAAQANEGEKSILQRLFIGASAATNTWITIGIIFVIPVLVSWVSGVAENLSTLDQNVAIYTACMSMLLVLITLELSQINEINERNRKPWRGLLTLALSLDLISIIVLSGVKYLVFKQLAGNWNGVVGYVTIIGVAALVSSFMVVLFTRKAGEKA